MFSLSFTRVVHETLAVETETETFLIRDETEMRRHEGVHEAGFRGGRANGPSPRPPGPSPGEAPRPWGPRDCLYGAPHHIVGEGSVLGLWAVGWGDGTAPWGPRKYVMT